MCACLTILYIVNVILDMHTGEKFKEKATWQKQAPEQF